MIFVFIMFIKDYEYIVNKIHHAKRKSIHFSFIFYTLYLIVIALLFTYLLQIL
jgi:membrane protein